MGVPRNWGHQTNKIDGTEERAFEAGSAPRAPVSERATTSCQLAQFHRAFVRFGELRLYGPVLVWKNDSAVGQNGSRKDLMLHRACYDREPKGARALRSRASGAFNRAARRARG